VQIGWVGAALIRVRSEWRAWHAACRVLLRVGCCGCWLCCRESVDGHLVTPATVTDVVNLGWTVKYVLRFDDDVEVRRAHGGGGAAG
jgi:hypothetical protein